MPVRINLKELFGSDSQEITIDKLNFNFNKLLELGIGLQGAKGITGSPGALGPSGPKGDKGDKGNQWFVGNGDPNSQTFTGLLDGDFFVNSNDSQIWQYDLGTDTWTIVVDLEGVVNNYLTTQGTTFVRGLGTGSPDDSRFIVFPNRGNDASIRLGDQLGAGVENDVLFLNNFNEKIDSVWTIPNFPNNTNNLFNSLHAIYVDLTNPSVRRYHMDMGSLYNDGVNDVISELNTNFKFRHDVVSIGSPVYVGNDFLYKGILSISNPEDYTIGEVQHAGIFEFQTPKRDPNSPASSENILVQIGSRFSLGEESSYVLHDGINIKSSVYAAGLGIATNFDNKLTEIDGNTYFVLDTGGNVDAIMLNTDTFQDGGNFKQLSTTLGREIIEKSSDTNGFESDENYYASTAIHINGDRLYAIDSFNNVTGAVGLAATNTSTHIGAISKWDLANEADPYEILTEIKTGASQVSIGPNDYIMIAGVGLSDIKYANGMIYLVNNQTATQYDVATVGSQTVKPVFFQVFEDSNYVDSDASFSKIGKYGSVRVEAGTGDSAIIGWNDNYDSNEWRWDGAYKMTMAGPYAVVVTNKLRHFGDSNTQSSTSHWGTSAATSNSYNLGSGHILLVDPTDVDNISIQSYLEKRGAHYLDVDYNDGRIATLAVQVGEDNGSGTGFLGHDVIIKIATINTLPDGNTANNNIPDNQIEIEDLGEQYVLESSATELTLANSQDNSVINKFGSIHLEGDTIYTIYKNTVYVHKLYVEGSSYLGASPVLKTSFMYSADTSTRVLGTKKIGDSIYVLVGQGGSNSYNPASVKLIKLNLNSSDSYKKVWELPINKYFTSFDIYGGKIYLYGNGSPRKLKVIEIDSIISENANIGHLKVDEIMSNGNASFRGNVNIGDGLNVGKLGIASRGGIYSDGGMSNASKKWHHYQARITGYGTGNGEYIQLNHQHGFHANKEWTYKIILTNSDISIAPENGVTYHCYWDDVLGQWIGRVVSRKDQGETGHPELYIGIGENKFKAYTTATTPKSMKIQVNIESTYIGSAKGTVHTLGADGTWQRLGDNLFYNDGAGGVSIGTSAAPPIDGLRIGGFGSSLLLGPNIQTTSDPAVEVYGYSNVSGAIFRGRDTGGGWSSGVKSDYRIQNYGGYFVHNYSFNRGIGNTAEYAIYNLADSSRVTFIWGGNATDAGANQIMNAYGKDAGYNFWEFGRSPFSTLTHNLDGAVAPGDRLGGLKIQRNLRVENSTLIGGTLEVHGYETGFSFERPFTFISSGTPNRAYSGGDGNHGSPHPAVGGTNWQYTGRDRSAWFNRDVQCQNGIFVSGSDKRIKDILKISDSSINLDKISNIEVTEYKYIENLDNVTHTKLIAQNILEVHPEAVSKDNALVPNILKFSKSISVLNEETEYTEYSILFDEDLENVSDIKAGNRLKLFNDKDKVGEFEISEVKSSEITVKIPNGYDFNVSEKVYVYGSYVDDFLSIDYDHIMCLNISATQELHKQLKAKDQEISDLKSRLSAIEQKLGL